MIETSVNSVRVSLRLKQLDELDEILARKFARFLMLRADNFSVLRRKHIAGAQLSLNRSQSILPTRYCDPIACHSSVRPPCVVQASTSASC